MWGKAVFEKDALEVSKVGVPCKYYRVSSEFIASVSKL
jgi:hypothetical protein